MSANSTPPARFAYCKGCGKNYDCGDIMPYSAIRPGAPCEKRYFYRQGSSIGFVLSVSLVAFLLGVYSLV